MPAPETRAEKLEDVTAEVQRQIDLAYKNRSTYRLGTREWNVWDIAIDELLDMKEEIVKSFKERHNG